MNALAHPCNTSRSDKWNSSSGILAGAGRPCARGGAGGERDAVVRALAWQAHGMDIADALHLALSHHSSQFKTFDKNLAKAAKRVAAKPMVSAPD